MVAVPAGLPVGIVEGRFLFVSQDKADVDAKADYDTITGTVKFTCSSKKPLQVASQDLVIVPLVFWGEFDSNGYLRPLEGQVGEVGMELPASSSEVYNPSGFTYKVEFNFTDPKGNRIKVDPFNIYVEEGVVNQLADQLPLGESGGTIITRGERGTDITGVTSSGDDLIFAFSDATTRSVDISAPLDAAVASRVMPSSIALDTDGVPYILPGANDLHVLFDTDGVPYWTDLTP